jgi:hypothetical protein
MDDVLASRVWSAEIFVALSERMHTLVGLEDPGYPPADGASGQLSLLSGKKRRDVWPGRTACSRRWHTREWELEEQAGRQKMRNEECEREMRVWRWGSGPFGGVNRADEAKKAEGPRKVAGAGDAHAICGGIVGSPLWEG